MVIHTEPKTLLIAKLCCDQLMWKGPSYLLTTSRLISRWTSQNVAKCCLQLLLTTGPRRKLFLTAGDAHMFACKHISACIAFSTDLSCVTHGSWMCWMTAINISKLNFWTFSQFSCNVVCIPLHLTMYRWNSQAIPFPKVPEHNLLCKEKKQSSPYCPFAFRNAKATVPDWVTLQCDLWFDGVASKLLALQGREINILHDAMRYVFYRKTLADSYCDLAGFEFTNEVRSKLHEWSWEQTLPLIAAGWWNCVHMQRTN